MRAGYGAGLGAGAGHVAILGNCGKAGHGPGEGIKMRLGRG